MPSVLDFINNQFKKSGVEMSASMKEALNNPELTKISLDDDLVKQHNEKTMTLEVAKENPIIKQHFRHVALNPIDTSIDEKLLVEYEIPDAEAAAIKAEKNTYEKIQLLLKSAKVQMEGKATKAVGDKATLIKQIEERDASLVNERARAKLELEKSLADNKEKERDWNIKGSLASYSYSKSYGDRADAIALAQIKLNRKLQADGAKVILGADGQPKLVSAVDEALEFTRENQKVNYKDYIDKLVADEKMIEINDKTPITPAGQNPPPPNGTGGNKDILPGAMADIEKDLANALKTS